VEAPAPSTTLGARRPGALPQVAQELGSIDPRKVEQTFVSLQAGPLGRCHRDARERLEFLAGDVKVFLRIDATGSMKYGYLEDSTLGDRAAEKCLLGVLASTRWPRPEGGEAEVRSGFGWGPGGEREPSNWPSDKVTAALVEAKAVRRELDRCRAGISGDFRVTAYVEERPEEAREEPTKKRPPKPGAGFGKPAVARGRFKAIGVAPPNKEAAEKVDCVVDALKVLDLPSPGGYAAKVSFTL
jgi:hypothetical protein